MNKKMIVTILFCVMIFSTVLFMAGCQPSEQAIQTAVAQTQEAQPTSTKIAFGEIDIQGILIQPGDLPSNYEAGQVKYDWPTDTGLPMKVKPDNFILQMFNEKADNLLITPNFSMLALYDDKHDADISYVEIIKSYKFQHSVPPIAGDASSIMHYQAGEGVLTIDATLLIFRRCNSLVVIRVFDWNDDMVFAYAKGLDKRVEKIACQ